MKARRAARFAAFMATAIAFAAPAARATDFSVLEAHGGYELHADGGHHGSYGLGFTWDTFVTATFPRGVELGARADLLHCPECDEALDGGALVGSVLVTAWKDDLSCLTPYLGLAGGGGHSRETAAVFGMGELQLALQYRAIYDGFWLRPVLFAGAGGAYDGYFSAGLRLAVGFALNPGVEGRTTQGPRRDSDAQGLCDPPIDATLPAGQTLWIVRHCYRAGVEVLVDGRGVPVVEREGHLEVQIGAGVPSSTQRVEIVLPSGSFTTRLRRP